MEGPGLGDLESQSGPAEDGIKDKTGQDCSKVHPQDARSQRAKQSTSQVHLVHTGAMLRTPPGCLGCAKHSSTGSALGSLGRRCMSRGPGEPAQGNEVCWCLWEMG